MYAILRYEGKIVSFDLSTTTPDCLNHFIKQGPTLIEYRDFR